jgi:solute carrier family 35 protein F5
VLTYLGASLLVIYLPVSYLKDFLCGYIKRRTQHHIIITHSKDNSSSSVHLETFGLKLSSVLPGSPLRSHGVQKHSNTDLEMLIHKQDFGMIDAAEAGSGLRESLDKGGASTLTLWDVAKISLVMAPLWLLTEYLSNAALALTSVASTTILSSTAGLFTLLFGVLLGQDSLNLAKVVAVFVSITGVAMTTLGKTWSSDESSNSLNDLDQHSLSGDILGLLSAVSYGLFTVMLKRYAGEEGEKVDMQRVFGFMGLFILVGSWWLGVNSSLSTVQFSTSRM